MFKNLLGTRLLIILLMLTTIGLSASADSWSYPESKPETPFDGGTDTINDPYRIATAQQLANFAWMVNDGTDFEEQYVVLTADITLNTIRCSAGTHRVVNIETYTPWVMIGHERTFSDDNFEGTFDGAATKSSASTSAITAPSSAKSAAARCATWCSTPRSATTSTSATAITTSSNTTPLSCRCMP